MSMFDRKKADRLLVKLQEEYARLPDYNAFGDYNYKEQYPIIFDYLKTGIEPENIDEDYDVLWTLINDFDQVYEDYCT
jgi:hypothetical protein